jgi:hypothetical protein
MAPYKRTTENTSASSSFPIGKADNATLTSETDLSERTISKNMQDDYTQTEIKHRERDFQLEFSWEQVKYLEL